MSEQQGKLPAGAGAPALDAAGGRWSLHRSRVEEVRRAVGEANAGHFASDDEVERAFGRLLGGRPA